MLTRWLTVPRPTTRTHNTQRRQKLIWLIQCHGWLWTLQSPYITLLKILTTRDRSPPSPLLHLTAKANTADFSSP